MLLEDGLKEVDASGDRSTPHYDEEEVLYILKIS
jgi:hypothetical protein